MKFALDGLLIITTKGHNIQVSSCIRSASLISLNVFAGDTRGELSFALGCYFVMDPSISNPEEIEDTQVCPRRRRTVCILGLECGRPVMRIVHVYMRRMTATLRCKLDILHRHRHHSGTVDPTSQQSQDQSNCNYHPSPPN